MSRSGEDAPTEGRPAGPEHPEHPDRRAPAEGEQPEPASPRPSTGPEDDPFTGYEPL